MQQYGAAGWAPTPSFCAIQAAGKKRRVDDAHRGEHNLATAQNERQTVIPAMQPATRAKLAFEHADLAGRARPAVRTGVADLPNAFRSSPCRHERLQYSVVCLRQPGAGENRAQQLSALLFGLSPSFFNYGRAAALLETMGRRILHLLFDFYVDDGLRADQTTAGNSGMGLLV